jgi:general secretion pathway protein B
MSFILDALRKSEAERQQQAGGEFSNVPSSPDDSQSPKWLWILALLLLVNIVVLLGILLRPDAAPDAETRSVTVPADSAPAEPAPTLQPSPAEDAGQTAPSFEERVAVAKKDQPAPEPTAAQTAQAATASPAPAATAAERPSRDDRLMTLDELRLAGSIQLPELHLDIHVYAEKPAERFVFVNMNKHRENSRLDEGPVVVEITPEGVVLRHQGQTFLLPRE